MSGLFDTLIDAARGTAPMILQRPRQHFAPFETMAGPAEPDGEVRPERAVPSSPPVDDRRETPVAVGRGEEKRPAARPRGEAASMEARTRAGRAARRELPAAPEEPVRRSPPSARPAETRPALPTSNERGSEVEPQSDREPAVPPPAMVRVAGQEVELLLPEMARPAETGPAGEPAKIGPPPFAPEQSAGEEPQSGPARFELRIGRIEVTAPRPQLAVPPAKHAVIVPRARPRQSLDDYLSRRRR